MSHEVLSHVFENMASYDKISPSLLEHIYKNAKMSADTSTLLTVASRSDLPVSLHKSLLALKNPAITSLRLKYMSSGDLHALVSATGNKKVYVQAAQCTNLLDSTVTVLLNNGNSQVWEKLLLNKGISGSMQQNALARCIEKSLNSKGKPLKSSAQLILSFPEYADTMFATLSRVDPLYTSRLACLLLDCLPWASKVGNLSVVDVVSTFSKALTSMSAVSVGELSGSGKPAIPIDKLMVLSKQYGWSMEKQYNSDTSVIYVRHALSNISKLVSMGILQNKTRQEVTDSLEKSLAFLKDNANKAPLTDQERTHTLGRLADILASLRNPPRNPKGSLFVAALAAKSPADLDVVIDSLSDCINSLDLVAILSSPHYRHSSAIADILSAAPAATPNQCWPNVRKAMEHRSPVSSEVLATLCTTRQARIPVSIAYIDTLLGRHGDPVATLAATLKSLKSSDRSTVIGLVGSRYFDAEFIHDVPLAEIPSKIPTNVLKVLVESMNDPSALSANWDILSLTTNFPKISLKEALESSKLLSQ